MLHRKRLNALLDTDPTPEHERQVVALVTQSTGGNQFRLALAPSSEHLVPAGSNIAEAPGQVEILAQLQPKLRGTLWIRSSDFVVAEIAETPGVGGKRVGTILHVLRAEHVRRFKAQGIWPADLPEPKRVSAASDSEDCDAAGPESEFRFSNYHGERHHHSSDDEGSGADTGSDSDGTEDDEDGSDGDDTDTDAHMAARLGAMLGRR
ncbi:hypothetical protein H696_00825 [Fonticula alba]|uniref:S1-like domain-containing protein n=1 Tax=Fonticula alba TaxID=691883 RepID=A0A058ZH68_FONAL|nr:hypothetical protein H696_00825 [Fonticula alba]KCV73283.1 hypothetical protein H696_00825 [Fonticula alba]|eukprot:XP_009492984.1 hypothetical protein H696_00825 [Fonticula alba]